ncbi:ATP-binding protein [Polyangium mundeleinium]|uniref:ATP-binding protein n=1 Tax=Polyangium mundeleinium TaxID=2995306 RepID=A0ABT5ESI1_9BACT|nr:ATP-binding protein [Polyangium mundeleinium]MDC0744778.1 ATP-binding protein [Polyangium mundeleinium]
MTELSTLPNPFQGNVVLDAWSATVDVAAIHQGPFQQCLQSLDSASRGTPDSILIFGPAGSGKTHLLARLQRHLVETANAAPDGTLRCVFVSVKLQTNAQLLWQHVRRRLTIDLLRKQQGLTQLQRLMAHQVASQRGEPPKRWVRALRVFTGTDGESVTDYLEEVAQRLELSRNLCVVLDHLVHNRFPMDATAWLCGDSLPESALGRLGLATEEQEDREEAARQVVIALCKLAGETLPIVFCFDQIEALQQSRDDHDSLFRFGRMAADLSEADRNVLLISCVQSAFVELLNTGVREADRDRIFKRRSVLEPLTREQVEALLVHRLDRVEALRDRRKKHGGSRVHPFSDAFLAELSQTSPCVPRRVLAAAATAFERLQRGEPELRDEAPPEPARVEVFLRDTFAARRSSAIQTVKPEESRDTLLHGLPMLWALRGQKTQPLRPPGVDLLLPSGRGPIRVTVCNESNMTSLAAHLRQVMQAAGGSKSSHGRHVILRDPRLPITRTAKKTQEYLAELEKRGARVVKPSVEALAALEALRSLLSDARAGDLAERGEVVSEGAVSAWLAQNLDDALTDLIEALDEGETRAEASRESRLERDLDDVLLRRFVVGLEALATELGCSGDDALAAARRHRERIGVLEGPPVVLFAYVPAESLGHAAE